MFEMDDNPIQQETPISKKPTKSETKSEVECFIYTQDFDNLVGLSFDSLSLISKNRIQLGLITINSSCYSGETSDGDYICIFIHNGTLCVGKADKFYVAEMSLRPMAFFKSLETNIFDVCKALKWNLKENFMEFE